MCAKRIPPKLVVINDVAGFGHCSTAMALPVISILGVQACLVPTAFFSNHMSFPIWYSRDCTEDLPGYLQAWDTLSLQFDGIYVGFLGCDRQIELVEDFLKKHPESQVLLDPVLGDHGRTYSSVTVSHCEKLRRLLPLSHVITPNITEACLLTDTPFRESGWTKEALTDLSLRLHALGPKKAVITGIPYDNCLLNFYYEADPVFSTGMYSCPVRGQSHPGTGDLFASILAADMQNHIGFPQSVKRAADFVGTCIAGSEALKIPVCEGVCFENYLKELL